jgi:hypothetical protein
VHGGRPVLDIGIAPELFQHDIGGHHSWGFQGEESEQSTGSGSSESYFGSGFVPHGDRSEQANIHQQVRFRLDQGACPPGFHDL